MAGERLVGDEKTPLDPKKILEIKGIRETQQYLTDEVQKVYREQGVSIHDKHVEVIVRQMLRRVGVSEAGDSAFLPGEKVDARQFAERNKELVADGKQPAEGRPELMGITKASLATDSWLSAASFQETTRVLTEAAIEGKRDRLVRAQGERHHRQADPGRDGHEALPRHRHERARLRAVAVLLVRHRRRPRPRRVVAGHQLAVDLHGRWRRRGGGLHAGGGLHLAGRARRRRPRPHRPSRT